MKKNKHHPEPLSRRKFLFRAAGAALAATVAKVVESAASDRKRKSKSKSKPSDKDPEPLREFDLHLTVNGSPRALKVAAGKTLSEVLREDLKLTGVKIGCASAECGSCTVLVNSRPMYSCRLLAFLADHAYIETIEGVSAGPELHPLQRSFIEQDAMQCGFCTPGMICSSKALLFRNRKPTPEDIRAGLAGNFCRCGAYDNIVRAVESAAKR